jgi:hypothetical protein
MAGYKSRQLAHPLVLFIVARCPHSFNTAPHYSWLCSTMDAWIRGNIRRHRMLLGYDLACILLATIGLGLAPWGSPSFVDFTLICSIAAYLVPIAHAAAMMYNVPILHFYVCCSGFWDVQRLMQADQYHHYMLMFGLMMFGLMLFGLMMFGLMMFGLMMFGVLLCLLV